MVRERLAAGLRAVAADPEGWAASGRGGADGGGDGEGGRPPTTRPRLPSAFALASCRQLRTLTAGFMIVYGAGLCVQAMESMAQMRSPGESSNSPLTHHSEV